MNKFKKLGVTVALTSAVLAVTSSSVGAVTTATWNLVAVHSGYVNHSNTWVTNSGYNEVVIKGYQDTGSSSIPAKFEYSFKEDEWVGYGDHWVHQTVSGNYPKSGTWFSRTFSGVPNGIDGVIEIEALTGWDANCGGNAYQTQ